MLRENKNIKIKGYYCAARKEPTGMSGKHGSMILVKDNIGDVIELDFLKTHFQEEVIGIEIKRTETRQGLNVVTYYNQSLAFRGHRPLVSAQLNFPKKRLKSSQLVSPES